MALATARAVASTREMLATYDWHDFGDGIAVLELHDVDAIELAVYSDADGVIVALWLDSETGRPLVEARGGIA